MEDVTGASLRWSIMMTEFRTLLIDMLLPILTALSVERPKVEPGVLRLVDPKLPGAASVEPPAETGRPLMMMRLPFSSRTPMVNGRIMSDSARAPMGA